MNNTAPAAQRDTLVRQMADALGQYPQYAGYIDAPSVYRLRRRWVGSHRVSIMARGQLVVGGALETRVEPVAIIDPTLPRCANIVGFEDKPVTSASIFCPDSGHMCKVDVADLEPVEVLG